MDYAIKRYAFRWVSALMPDIDYLAVDRIGFMGPTEFRVRHNRETGEARVPIEYHTAELEQEFAAFLEAERETDIRELLEMRTSLAGAGIDFEQYMPGPVNLTFARPVTPKSL